VPFAQRLFAGLVHLLDVAALVPALVHLDGKLVDDPDVAGIVGIELALDALGPDFVGRLHADEATAVPLLERAPFEGELEVGEVLIGAKITGGMALAVEVAINDGPDVLSSYFRIAGIGGQAG